MDSPNPSTVFSLRPLRSRPLLFLPPRLLSERLLSLFFVSRLSERVVFSRRGFDSFVSDLASFVSLSLALRSGAARREDARFGLSSETSVSSTASFCFGREGIESDSLRRLRLRSRPRPRSFLSPRPFLRCLPPSLGKSSMPGISISSIASTLIRFRICGLHGPYGQFYEHSLRNDLEHRN